MKRNILYYILPLLTAFVSCNDDYMGNYPGNSSEGSTSISLEIDVPETRTRAIDMTPGAALYLNDIWVGVYRQGNGHRHAGTKNNEPIDLQHRMTASGVKLIDLVQIENTTEESLNNAGADFVIVGVANCKDVKTIDGKDLSQALKEADTWEKFVNIAIDTQQEFYAHTPVLMGYLQPEATDASASQYVYTKVDQYKNFNSISLVGSTTSGSGASNDNVWVRAATVTDGKINSFNTKGMILKLRRLRSKINVNIDSKDNVYVTNIDYKIYNLPKSAFLAQRRTNTFSESGKDGAQYSPNSADVKGDGYYNSDSWSTPGNNYSFSYEHFENNHWALPSAPLNEYHDREKHSGNTIYDEQRVDPMDLEKDKPVFSVLAGNDTDWNNNATYMVIRMKIRDENTGRYGDVYYTIHEGFINDEDGIATSDINTRLKDFTCIRNTDYYYNIRVNGIEDIVTTVSSNQTNSHLNDQAGSVWQMDYAKEANSYINQVVVTGESQYIAKEIKFDPQADIAFRLIGNWGGGHAVDICYNFARGPLDNFASLWTAPNNTTTEYLVGIGNEGDDNYISTYQAMENYFEANKNDSYINQLLNGIKIKIKDVEGYKTVKEYIEYINEEGNTNKDIEGFIYYKMDLATTLPNPEEYLRGLYIFDRQEAIEGKYKDADGCTIYQIYAAEQYPSQPTMKLKTPYIDMTGVIDNSFMAGLDDHTIEIYPVEGADTYEFTITGDNGYSYVETRTTGNEAQYTIVSKSKGTLTGSDTSDGGLTRFRKVSKNGREIYLYSVSYAASKGGLMSMTSGGTYTFSVKASDSGKKIDDSPVAQFTKTIYLPTWKFYESPWTNIGASEQDLGEGWSMTYNGLTIARGSNALQYRSVNNSLKYAFYTGGAGSYTSHDEYARAFMFHSAVSGKIAVTSSNTGGSEDTSKKISVWANNTTTISGSAGAAATTPATVTIGDITPDFKVDNNIENMVVYSTANLYIYDITFTPTGSARPFHKGVDDK